MPLINLLVIFVVLGVVWYLLTTFVPMPQPVKVVIGAFCALIAIVLLLQAFGFTNFTIGHHS